MSFKTLTLFSVSESRGMRRQRISSGDLRRSRNMKKLHWTGISKDQNQMTERSFNSGTKQATWVCGCVWDEAWTACCCTDKTTRPDDSHRKKIQYDRVETSRTTQARQYQTLPLLKKNLTASSACVCVSGWQRCSFLWLSLLERTGSTSYL